ncbi:MAG: acetate--CoA ligase family protein [Deltaproteobacteria bacterium]|nr:acetate--CoA ligase family protein [Deltaproteobacteria bacterium]
MIQIGELDPAMWERLTDRERAVLEVIDRVALFGGRERGKLEVVEALSAQRLADLFTDPEDQAIARSLAARFFPGSEAKKGGQVHGPGLIDAPKMPLARLFRPRAVAVIGATSDLTRVGGVVVQNLLRSKFPGRVYPVSAEEGSIQGVPAVRAIADLPRGVDLAVLSIPAAEVPAALDALGKKKVKNAIVISGGFRETGDGGKSLEEALIDTAKKHRMNVVGPNSVGLLTPAMNASYAASTPRHGGVVLLSQSGALVTASVTALEHTGFWGLVNVGNQSVLDATDYLAAVAGQPDVKTVAMYVERIADGRKFLETAARVTRDKPVIVLKGGRSDAGQEASMSHTGAIGGSTAGYEAAFRRAGVIAASTQEELLDLAKLFGSGQPLPKGRRVAMVTNAGGLAILTLDAPESRAFELAELSPKTQAKLREILPQAANVHNPVDLIGDARSDRYAAAIRAVLDDPAVDALVCFASPQGMTDGRGIAQAIVDASSDAKKPVLCSLQGPAEMAGAEAVLELHGIPNFGTTERVARALSRLFEYAEHRARPEPTPAVTSLDLPAIAAAEKGLGLDASTSAPQVLGSEVLALLSAHGVPVVKQRFAPDLERAVEAASELGYPLVMKVRSPDILHKSDVGGVVLGIHSEAELRQQHQAMMARIASQRPAAKIDGVDLQTQAAPGHDLIVGVLRDPAFGPTIMLGYGGTAVEVWKDTTFELVPLNEEAIEAMIHRLKSYPLLAGARGAAPIDFEALKSVLRRVAALAERYGDQLEELDLNPVRASSTGAVVLDGRAKIKLRIGTATGTRTGTGRVEDSPQA